MQNIPSYSTKAPVDTTKKGPSPQNYKIVKCKYWEKEGTCRYGTLCTFAHGDTEVRSKTENIMLTNQQPMGFYDMNNQMPSDMNQMGGMNGMNGMNGMGGMNGMSGMNDPNMFNNAPFNMMNPYAMGFDQNMMMSQMMGFPQNVYDPNLMMNQMNPNYAANFNNMQEHYQNQSGKAGTNV